MPELSRRAALRLGVGAVAGATGVWAMSALLDPSDAPATPTPVDPAAADNALPTRVSGSFVSAARGGVLTNWIIARPPGQTGPLRPVIALHGVRGNAKQVMSFGVEDTTRRAGQGGPSADRGGRRRRRRQLLASAGRRRRRGFDGAQRADTDVGNPESGHLASGLHRLVDGRVRGATTGRPAGSARPAGFARSALRCTSRTPPAHSARSTATTIGRKTRYSGCRRCRRFRCEWTAG